MDNQNLIYDYCIHEKVAICFSSADQLDIILALMGYPKAAERNLFIRGGVCSFYQYCIRDGKVNYRIRQFYTKEFDDHILLSDKEFFTLALPNKSILESIK